MIPERLCVGASIKSLEQSMHEARVDAELQIYARSKQREAAAANAFHEGMREAQMRERERIRALPIPWWHRFIP